MSWPHIAIYCVVGLSLLAARRNLTAAALCLSWMAGEVTWQITGNNLPISTYVAADLTVISVILARAVIREGCNTYPTLREQLRCLWHAVTVCDKLIVGLFLLGAWPIYASNLHPYYTWWGLYWITVAQFALAGTEAFLDWLHPRPVPRDDRPVADIIPFIRRAERPPATLLPVRGAWGDG